MNIRYRWFEIGISGSFAEFIKKISNNIFKDSSYSGFRTINISAHHATFQYIWRNTVFSTNINNLGDDELIPIETTEILTIDFSLAKGKVILKVENPKKSLKMLMSSLENIVLIGFYQKPIIFQYETPDKLFSDFENILTTKLVVSGMSLSKDVVAKMELTSIKGIHKNKLSILDDQKYSIDLVAYEIMYKNITSTVVFSKTGLVKLSGELTEKILDTLEMTLLE